MSKHVMELIQSLVNHRYRLYTSKIFITFVWIKRKNICLITLALLFEFAHGQKPDKVLLVNGDVLTGEIKSMQLAKLKYDMDGPGIIDIKWEKVKAIRSDRVFEITLRSGEVIVNKPDSLFFEQNSIALDDIVEMLSIKNKVWKRLYGDFNAGFNYAKSSQIGQLNFNGTFGYRIPKLEIIFSPNSYITKQSKDSGTTREQDLSLNGLKYLDKGLFFGFGIKLQQNTELGLANRFIYSGLLGKDWVRDNHNRLLTAGGVSLNREQSLESESYSTNIDAIISVVYKLFYYSAPKRSVDLTVNSYPGLSEWGRIRVDMELNTSIEVFKDFLVGLNFYEKFDNQPPEGATSKNDYGVTFTIGYKFNK